MKNTILVILIIVVLAGCASTKEEIVVEDIETSLIYNYQESWHSEFYFEGDYVVFVEKISITNSTEEKYLVYAFSDVSSEWGLVKEDIAVACEKDSLEEQAIEIAPDSTEIYTMYFKALKGESEVKKDRMPPSKIEFKVIE